MCIGVCVFCLLVCSCRKTKQQPTNEVILLLQPNPPFKRLPPSRIILIKLQLKFFILIFMLLLEKVQLQTEAPTRYFFAHSISVHSFSSSLNLAYKLSKSYTSSNSRLAIEQEMKPHYVVAPPSCRTFGDIGKTSEEDR